MGIDPSFIRVIGFYLGLATSSWFEGCSTASTPLKNLLMEYCETSEINNDLALRMMKHSIS
jgi:hypothetical protein